VRLQGQNRVPAPPAISTAKRRREGTEDRTLASPVVTFLR
jgi:hypothetical protein